MTQTGEPYWLKYYQQEDQARLFPMPVSAKMRERLTEAERSAAGDARALAAVAATARAFAVTEAFVAFDEKRRWLQGAVASDGAFKVRERELARMIGEWVDARVALEKALAGAKEAAGGFAAMTGTQLPHFVRNDPVPRLLWLAGQRDAPMPARLLAEASKRETCDKAWRLLADARLRDAWEVAPELLRNGSLAEAAGVRQEPGFLFPAWGELPAGWQVSAVATERGRTALLPGEPGVSGRGVRIEGAWDTQVFQWQRADAGNVYLARATMRGWVSPGSDAGLFFTFLAEDGKVVGTHRMQTLPKWTETGWVETVLADRAPEGTAWIGLGFGASRQGAKDWLEVRGCSLRAAELTDAEGGR